MPVAATRPAATTILLRDSPSGLEVWLMERSRQVGFMPAAWVFPGGRVDVADEVEGDRGGIPLSFWLAAARELHEEAGVRVRAEAMRPWSHWVTPEIEPRRYDTWFFAVVLPEGEHAVVDGAEAVRGGWFGPGEAVARCQAGDLPLAPPTLRTLAELAGFGDSAAVMAAPRRTPPILPRFSQEGDTLWVLLPGDPAHPSREAVDPPFRYAFDAGRWWAR